MKYNLIRSEEAAFESNDDHLLTNIMIPQDCFIVMC